MRARITLIRAFQDLPTSDKSLIFNRLHPFWVGDESMRANPRSFASCARARVRACIRVCACALIFLIYYLHALIDAGKMFLIIGLTYDSKIEMLSFLLSFAHI